MARRQYHDSIDTSVATPAAATDHTDAEYLGRAAQVFRMRAAFALLLLAGGIVGARAIIVQGLHGATFRARAEENRTRELLITPSRGRIIDRRGVPLVENVPTYAIGIVPADIPHGAERQPTMDAVARILGVPPDAISETLASYPTTLGEPIPLRDATSYDDAITTLVRARAIPAIDLIVGARRVYGIPGHGELESLSAVIGYVGRMDASEYRAHAEVRYRPSDVLGKTGVERTYESQLRGRTGRRTLSIDARGRVIGTDAVEPPVAGSDLSVTLDAAIQADAERVLRDALQSSGAHRGAVIALDAENGAILALVNLPAYSSTAFARGLTSAEYAALTTNPDHPLFPRAIAGTYPSGSTIKPVIAAAALSTGVITEQTVVHSTGGIRVGASFFPDWKAGGHGTVNVLDAIANSVNTFFYLIGGGRSPTTPPSVGGPTQEHALGVERIGTALHAFGFGAPTGIDLPGEASGLVPSPAWKQEERKEPWYLGDTYHLAIGQGDLLVTPMQIATATAAFANGGYRVTPHVAMASTGTASPATPIEGITNAAIATVRTGLRRTVTNGSGIALRDLPDQVFGKTGTAEHGSGHRPHAWFTGFVELPSTATDGGRSHVVVTVLVEEAGEGSHVAVPVARAVFRSIITSNASYPQLDKR